MKEEIRFPASYAQTYVLEGNSVDLHSKIKM